MTDQSIPHLEAEINSLTQQLKGVKSPSMVIHLITELENKRRELRAFQPGPLIKEVKIIHHKRNLF